MICYRCGSEMTRSVFRNTLIDKCKKCGGVWVDAGEIKKIMKWRPGDASKNFLGDRLTEQYIERVSNISAKGHCPRCGEPSLKTIIVDGIDLDKCRICNGLFFDGVEIENLLKRNSGFRKCFYRFKHFIKNLFR